MPSSPSNRSRGGRSGRWLAAAAVVVAFAAVACAEGSGRRRSDAGRDGGSSMDAAAADAAPMVDGGGADGDAIDGARVDAGADAAGVDAGGIDGGRPDAGPRDAGPRDSGPRDGGPRDAGCMSAAACSDGLACNGIERCVAGRCEPGTAIVCDDGVSCTVDTCAEPGTCAFTPNDGLCPIGSTCDGATGCVSGCSESPCRIVAPQCGCPGTQGCYINPDGSRFCATAGTAADGASCTGTTGCRAGSLCINIHATGTTLLCARFCSTDANCSGPGSLCITTLGDGMGGTLPGVTLCTRSCDPVLGTGCRSGAACDVYRETMGAMRFLTDCRAPVGTGTQGSPCADEDGCAAGYTCLDPDGTAGPRPSQCLHWCEVGFGDFGCGILDTCYGFTTPIVIGTTQYGVCDF